MESIIAFTLLAVSAIATPNPQAGSVAAVMNASPIFAGFDFEFTKRSIQQINPSEIPSACSSLCNPIIAGANECNQKRVEKQCQSVVCGNLQTYGDCLICMTKQAKLSKDKLQKVVDLANSLPGECSKIGFANATSAHFSSAATSVTSSAFWAAPMVVAAFATTFML